MNDLKTLNPELATQADKAISILGLSNNQAEYLRNSFKVAYLLGNIDGTQEQYETSKFNFDEYLRDWKDSLRRNGLKV